MATLIKMMGHECQFAINGFAALEIARSFQPDFILLDIGLPDYREVRERALDAGCEQVFAISSGPGAGASV